VTAAGIEPAPGGCRACHLDERFTPTRVDAALHGASGFALEGGHDAVGCYDCHAELEPEGVPRFAETPRACEACHDDVHAGAFDGATAALMEAPEGTSGCALCHVTSSFHDVPAVAEGRFDHAGLCGFALQGAHAEAACAACHGPELAGPGGDPGRSFGRVAVLTPGDPARCTTCHSDPHGEAFASGPAEIAGATDCLRCHDQQSFRLAAEAPFDHGLWTGFELLGPHAASDCASCHGRSASSAGGAEGTSLGRAAGSACADCHGDVHLGQFTLPGEPRTDCTRCHAVPGGAADGWIASRFDHDQTFELDPTHAALDCAACHLAYPTGSGLEVVRYRPLGRTCEACHGSPDPGGDR
jgi:hypothetical protein